MKLVMLVFIAGNVGVSLVHIFEKRYDHAAYNLCVAVVVAVMLGVTP
jgi:hypothetical protein